MARPISPDIQRVPVVCANCNTVYFRPKDSHAAKRCKPCAKVFRSLAKPKEPRLAVPKPKNHIETVLPINGTAKWDKKKEDWYIPVRTRKRGSKEPLARDRIYLCCGADVTPEQVSELYVTTYARLEMNGAKSRPVEERKTLRRKAIEKKHYIKNWKSGEDKNLGILRVRVSHIAYTVHLADPKTDGKRIYVGRFRMIADAREARQKKYEELQWQFVPCKLCGELPTLSNRRVTHLSSRCPNRVQFPNGLRPLFQTKLWNGQFSTGKFSHVGRLSRDDLHQMGFLSVRFRPNLGVEVNTSLYQEFMKQKEETFFE